jgi:hypothetical protein
MEDTVGNYQAGFRNSKSTTDQSFAMKQILEKCFDYDIDIHCIFTDFKQTFDGINRNELHKSLHKLGIPRKLINLIKGSLTNTKGKVVIQGICSEEFETQKGVKQGDAVSTILFNLALEMATRATTTDPRSTVFNRLTHADGVVIIGRNINALKQTFIEFTKEARKLSIAVNTQKTKYMITPQNMNRFKEVTKTEIEGTYYERTDKFEYLGTILSESDDMAVDVKA